MKASRVPVEHQTCLLFLSRTIADLSQTLDKKMLMVMGLEMPVMMMQMEMAFPMSRCCVWIRMQRTVETRISCCCNGK